MEENNNEDIDYCKTCKWARISHTQIIGAIIPEWYCGLTNTDEYCYGSEYESED